MPEINTEDVDEDEDPKMDLEELDQIDEGQIIEDIDVIALGPTPIADIAQIVAVWAAEMATQPKGFVIGEDELAEAIVEAQALTAVVEIAEDGLDDDEDIRDDDDLMDDDDVMDEDREIAADPPEEMTFGPA